MNFEVVVSPFVDHCCKNVGARILVSLDGVGVTGLRRNDFSLYVPAQHEADGFDESLWGWRFEFSHLESAILERTDSPQMRGLYDAQLQSEDVIEDVLDPRWAEGNYYGILTVTHTVEVVIGTAGPSRVIWPGTKPHDMLVFGPQTLVARTNFSFYVPAQPLDCIPGTHPSTIPGGGA
ncbi:hypothetical protein NOV72_06224 [Caballeronia novacaledonica]|uniref:Uncharacterized protein n=1 Tax=Caballeronia novacaledonica TaxID=1544861 RepID=A0A2U3IFX5_9BURK|nr:hypothetical protein [Caballeronia novacaledonica]SPB19023.1 hypothetical protein NOV72_06224 [Caballeronia novacaledonica]